MQTTLDIDYVLRLWFLACEHQTPQFRGRMATLGWQEEKPGTWVRRADRESARAIRRLLGKGMLVTTAATAWYAQATA